MKTTMIWTLALLLAAPAAAEDAPLNEAVTKAVRAVVASTKEKDIEKYRKELFARTDLDWPSFKEGLMLGGYYRKPIVTEMGVRHGGKHLGVRLTGADGKNRGFSLYLPQGYTAVDKIPVLVYLHHNAWAPVEAGTGKSDVAIRKFKDVCEEYNVMLLAPYTGAGAEWWKEEGVDLIKWSLRRVAERYNIDEDRVGLVGALDGADAVWLVAQRMPGTFSVLMPMTGDPYEMTALIRPIYLGTIDRMDVLVGVPGNLRSQRFGNKNVHSILDGLKPMFDKRMRLTLSVQMGSNSDFHYLDRIKRQMAAFLLDKEHARKALADEVDIESDGPDALRSLWLEVKGYDADVKPPRRNFPSTRLVWNAPKRKEPGKKMGLGLDNRDNWPLGKVVTNVNLGAKNVRINRGDVLVMVDGTIVKKGTDLGGLLKDKKWGDEIEVVLARHVDVRGREAAEREQKQYMQVRRKVAELKAAGKRVPTDLTELIEDEDDANEDEDEDEDDGESAIEISDGDGEEEEEEDVGGKGDGNKPKRTWFVFKRWIELVRPEGHADSRGLRRQLGPQLRQGGRAHRRRHSRQSRGSQRLQGGRRDRVGARRIDQEDGRPAQGVRHLQVREGARGGARPQLRDPATDRARRDLGGQRHRALEPDPVVSRGRQVEQAGEASRRPGPLRQGGDRLSHRPSSSSRERTTTSTSTACRTTT